MPFLKNVGAEPPDERQPLPWSELAPLAVIFEDGWRFEDEDINPFLEDVVFRFLHDIRRMQCKHFSDFINQMVDSDFEMLSYGQIRGILNVLGGTIRGQRKRFWKSRDRRRDRDDGLENCIICGGPLNDSESVDRGCGNTCYRRALGVMY